MLRNRTLYGHVAATGVNPGERMAAQCKQVKDQDRKRELIVGRFAAKAAERAVL
jgi:mannose-6-phosphate isomerase class I